MAALSLPATATGEYAKVRRAVLDQMGYSTEENCCRFHVDRLGPVDQPFVYRQQLRDAARRWLQLGESAREKRTVEAVVL